MALINFEKYNVLMDKSYTSQLGKVAKVVGLTIESIGPSAKLNDLCLIRSNNRTEPVKAEVVGFRDDRVLLMPYDDVEGVGLGSWVENTGAPKNTNSLSLSNGNQAVYRFYTKRQNIRYHLSGKRIRWCRFY